MRQVLDAPGVWMPRIDKSEYRVGMHLHGGAFPGNFVMTEDRAPVRVGSQPAPERKPPPARFDEIYRGSMSMPGASRSSAPPLQRGANDDDRLGVEAEARAGPSAG